MIIYSLWDLIQRRIQKPIRHLKWSFLRKYWTAENLKLFSLNASFQMFDWVLNITLLELLIFYTALTQTLKNKDKKTQKFWVNSLNTDKILNINSWEYI